MKTCTRCGMEYPGDQFYANKRTKDGLHQYCKGCCTVLNRESRQKVAKEKRKAREKVSNSPVSCAGVRIMRVICPKCKTKLEISEE